jgi:hypothetical protein
MRFACRITKARTHTHKLNIVQLKKTMSKRSFSCFSEAFDTLLEDLLTFYCCWLIHFTQNIVVQQSIHLYSLEWLVAQPHTECIFVFSYSNASQWYGIVSCVPCSPSPCHSSDVCDVVERFSIPCLLNSVSIVPQTFPLRDDLSGFGLQDLFICWTQVLILLWIT